MEPFVYFFIGFLCAIAIEAYPQIADDPKYTLDTGRFDEPPVWVVRLGCLMCWPLVIAFAGWMLSMWLLDLLMKFIIKNLKIILKK